MQIHLAPMQGFTDYAYRTLHAGIYGACDAAYTPFIRIENGQPRHRDIAGLQKGLPTRLADKSASAPAIPQIIFNSIGEFRTLTEAIKALGYTRIDLNLGCPYPMQTRRGRGAAMIGDIDTMREISEAINADSACSYSVKMRVGLARPDEWTALMPTLNDTRLTHITLHPRTASQMYSGELHHDEFKHFTAETVHIVIWNGNIVTPDDIDRIAALYPSVSGVMIGRGILARPSIVAEWREKRIWPQHERMEHLLQFHKALFETYSNTLCGDMQILQKIKTFWEYLDPEIGHKAAKAIRKAGTLQRYLSAVDSL